MGMKLYILEVPCNGYGVSFYAVIQATTSSWARMKMRAKWPKTVQHSVSSSDMYDAEIDLDENGVSQLLAHRW